MILPVADLNREAIQTDIKTLTESLATALESTRQPLEDRLAIAEAKLQALAA